MTVRVRFSRNGCYLPAFGRLGMGDNAGRIYDLPEAYREEGMLPKSAQILDDVDPEVLEKMLEDANQKQPQKPPADPEELKKAVEQAKARSAAAAKKAPAKKKPAPKPEVEEPEEVDEVDDETPAVQRRSRRGSR